MTIKRYTKEEAEQILATNTTIKAKYNECKEDYEYNELDCTLSSIYNDNCANIRNLEENPTKLVVQFISDEPTEYTECIDEEDNTIYNTLIADSLEEAVLIACLEI